MTKRDYQHRANIKIGLGLIMILGTSALAAAIRPMNEGTFMVLLTVRLLGLVPWFWGLGNYCQSKGRAPMWAALGVLGLIGLLILLVMPDTFVDPQTEVIPPPTVFPNPHEAEAGETNAPYYRRPTFK